MPFIQEKSGHCVVYAYANVFPNLDFQTHFANKEMEGADYYREEAMIKDVFGYRYGLTQAIYVNTGFKKGISQDQWERIMVGDPMGEGRVDSKFPVLVYIATVRRRGDKGLHRIAILSHTQLPNLYVVVDSFTNSRAMVFDEWEKIYDMYGAWFALSRMTFRDVKREVEIFTTLSEYVMTRLLFDDDDENRDLDDLSRDG